MGYKCFKFHVRFVSLAQYLLYFLRMKRYFYIVLLAISTSSMYAQPPFQDCPQQRTPEDIAEKQTMMLRRELGLTDSVQLDTLYRMHLKYAKLRIVSNTRAEDLERLQAMTLELKNILTDEQYRQFMDHQVDDRPRHPHAQQGPLAPNMPPPPPDCPMPDPR